MGVYLLPADEVHSKSKLTPFMKGLKVKVMSPLPSHQTWCFVTLLRKCQLSPSPCRNIQNINDAMTEQTPLKITGRGGKGGSWFGGHQMECPI